MDNKLNTILFPIEQASCQVRLKLILRVIVLIVVPDSSSWMIDRFSDLQKDLPYKNAYLVCLLSTYLSFSIWVAATLGISRARR